MGNVKTAGSRLLAAFMAICLAATMAVSASSLLVPAQQAHADTNQAVLDQRAGVFKFNWGYKGEYFSRGSAFLINENTIVTAYHCVQPGEEEFSVLAGLYGVSVDELKQDMTYTVTITGDFQVPATIEKVSEAQDIAILRLDQELNNVKALPLRDSSTVDASEEVYSLGFPPSSEVGAIVTYTVNDVTVMNGMVSKPEFQTSFTYRSMFRGVAGQQCSGSFLLTTCRIDEGGSGGPMLDANGNVIGVCVSSDSSDYFYAAASDVLMAALDTMAYDYTRADVTAANAAGSAGSASSSAAAAKEEFKLSFTDLNAAISAAEGLDASKYTEASYKAVTDALAAAKEALNTELKDATDEAEYNEAQAAVDAAAEALNTAVSAVEEAPTGPNMGLIIGIIVAVVVVIAIIVLVLVMRGRNKKKQEDAPTVPLGANAPAAAPSQPALQSGGSQSWQKPGAAASSAGVSETTILDDEASDTVILFQAASGGSLTRMSTNEQIPINSAEFTIGRERSKVNYCLEGNTSISRVHVRILVRDGKVYCVDNKAANGTYINGVKCRPGEEVLLKSGDIITLADEKFKYNA